MAAVSDPHYINESKGPISNTVCIVFMVLSFIVISLRLFSRLWVVRAMGLDDGKLCDLAQVIAVLHLLIKYLCSSDLFCCGKPHGGNDLNNIIG